MPSPSIGPITNLNLRGQSRANTYSIRALLPQASPYALGIVPRKLIEEQLARRLASSGQMGNMIPFLNFPGGLAKALRLLMYDRQLGRDGAPGLVPTQNGS